MRKLMAVALCVPLMASTAIVASGQNGYQNRGYDNQGNNQYQNNRGNNQYQNNRGNNQYQDNRGYNQYQDNRGNNQYQDNRGYNQYQDNRGYSHYQYDRGSHQQFSSGAYEGGRGGDYGYDHDGRYSEYDRRYHGNGNYYGDPQYRHDNGIGPGKGALIGGAGGAVLGTVLGGGKGAFVGGAAGAGIGAILGEHAQQERREQPY